MAERHASDITQPARGSMEPERHFPRRAARSAYECALHYGALRIGVTYHEIIAARSGSSARAPASKERAVLALVDGIAPR